MDVMRRFAEETANVSVIDRKAELEGRSLIMILAPKGEKQ
jgi:translation initiation factor IF-3